jgi:hypothetical protein
MFLLLDWPQFGEAPKHFWWVVANFCCASATLLRRNGLFWFRVLARLASVGFCLWIRSLVGVDRCWIVVTTWDTVLAGFFLLNMPFE